MWTENGTMYNNQYCLVLRFDGEEMAEFHLHMDDHVDRTYGQFGWVDRTPATGPRKLVGTRCSVLGRRPEAPFEITKQFDIDPVMVRDPVPPTGRPLLAGTARIEGNRALVLGRGARRLASGLRPPSTASTGRASGASSPGSPAVEAVDGGLVARCQRLAPRPSTSARLPSIVPSPPRGAGPSVGTGSRTITGSMSNCLVISKGASRVAYRVHQDRSHELSRARCAGVRSTQPNCP